MTSVLLIFWWHAVNSRSVYVGKGCCPKEGETRAMAAAVACF